MTPMLALLERATDVQDLVLYAGAITIYCFTRHVITPLIERYPDILRARTERMLALHSMARPDAINVVPIPLKSAGRICGGRDDLGRAA